MKKIALSLSDAKLKSLNTRVEGNQKEPVRAVDIKFETVAPASFLGDIGGCDGVIPDLWYPSGSPKFAGIEKIEARTALEGARLSFGDLVMTKIELTGVKLNKFAFRPAENNTVHMTFRAQLHPTDEQLIALSKAISVSAPLDFEVLLNYTGDDAGDLLDDEAQDEE